VTLPHTFSQAEKTGIIRNFGIAAGEMCCDQSGNYPFDDTDVYKALEGASYLLARSPDDTLEAFVDQLVALIGAAQEDDGYLYTWRTNRASPRDTIRWSNLRWGHELYNAGHLYEAAAAHYQARGKRTLLDIAIKNADLVEAIFGPGKRLSPPGHQEIELGLVKLYRITGDRRYLNLASFFLEERGFAHDGRELWGEYAQDHVPLRDQDEAVGHAVRAAYFYAALADVAALTSEKDYLRTLDRLWRNVVEKKMYVTGGTGAVGQGERFGDNYELPNLSAYGETCASIAQVMWNYRMFLLSGDAKYIDVMERVLYNALLAGISMEGNTFFYPNPLVSRGFDERSPWFYCSCCVSNLSRFIPSLPSYIYAQENDDLYVNLFVGSRTVARFGGTSVRLVQETSYPWEGTVTLSIDSEEATPFTLYLRIPGWAKNEPIPGGLYNFTTSLDTPVRLLLNDEELTVLPEKGYIRISRQWENGDQVKLILPMPVRRLIAVDSVEADAGKIALQRGPLVYCLEGPDHTDEQVLSLVLPDEAPVSSYFRADMLNGVITVLGQGRQVYYNADGDLESRPRELVAIPYYAWAHRGFAEMTVWIPREASKAEPLNGPSIASRSHVSSSGGTHPAAVNDGTLSRDTVASFFAWSDTSTTAWIAYEFENPEEISAVDVYWYDDGEGIRIPARWRVMTFADLRWQPVFNPYGTWPTEPGTYNRAMFETVRTSALRLEVTPQSGVKAGILEWKVY